MGFGYRMKTSEEKHRVLLEKLDLKNKFENLLIDISTGFIKLQGNALNLGINDALRKIGTFIQADRSYLFQINLEDTKQLILILL
jgi:hypothetical protein